MKKLMRNNGITLIEVIISIAILSIISTMGITAIYSSNASKNTNATLRQNSEKAVGNLDNMFDNDLVATEAVNVSVDFPGSIADESLSCEKVSDEVYNLDIGIVRAK